MKERTDDHLHHCRHGRKSPDWSRQPVALEATRRYETFPATHIGQTGVDGAQNL